MLPLPSNVNSNNVESIAICRPLVPLLFEIVPWKVVPCSLSFAALFTPRHTEKLVEDDGSDGVDNNVNP